MLQQEGNKDERERSKIVVRGKIMKTIGQIGDKTLPDKKCETLEWGHKESESHSPSMCVQQRMQDTSQ